MSLKEKILNEFRSNKNINLSGQSLAETFGVSRNAIWKVINSLKEDGYVFSSSTNKGYMLLNEPDIFQKDEIVSVLGNIAPDIIILDAIDSTNSEAKRMLSSGKAGNFLVLAEHQTGGRGRNGKSFYSPKSTGLYMSLALNMRIKLESAVSITSFVSVCVVKAINELTGLNPKIKWVNDIYLDNKKICGILCEAVSDFESGTVESVVIGVGINISKAELPDELKDLVGFLQHPGATKNKLCAEITKNILAFNENDRSYMSAYKSHSMVIGKDITFLKNSQWYNGKALDIDNDGGLIVENENSEIEVLKSGEISLRIK